MDRVYGYVNGEAVFSAEDFKYKARGFGAIQTDEELIKFAEKVTGGWSKAGWRRTFITFYLGSYALDEPQRSLTKAEYERLKFLQKQAQEAYKKTEEEKEWRKVDTVYWADNSVEEIWENKYGERKTIMTEYPHGDACY